MAEPSDNQTASAAETPGRSSPALYGLRPALVRAVIEAAEANDRERVRRLVEPLHYSDIADLLERLGSDQRKRVVVFIGPDLDPDAMAELDDAVREEVMDLLSPKQIAEVVSELETDDAVAVIEDLDKEMQKEVLAQVEPEERADIEQNLAFPEDSAGRMMQRDPVSIPAMWTVGETIDHMRETPDLPEDFYDIFVTDAQKRLKGTLPLNVLLRTKRPVRVAQIMKTDLVTIPATMDREEVARLFRDRDLVSAPVVDGVGRLVGMITVDDVVDVIQEEAEEDMMRLHRVSDAGIREAFRVFRTDLVAYEAAVRRAVKVPLAPHEFDALVSFHYNTGGIARAALTRHLNAGNRVAAAEAFMGWLKPAAIRPRREAERDLFRDGRYPTGTIPVWAVDRNGRVDFSRPIRRLTEPDALALLAGSIARPTPQPQAVVATWWQRLIRMFTRKETT